MSKYIKFWERFYIPDLFGKSTSWGIVDVDRDRCIGCGLCAKVCVGNAIVMDDDKRPVGNTNLAGIIIREPICGGCGACMAICPQEAITIKASILFGGRFKSLGRGPVSKPRLFGELAEKESPGKKSINKQRK